MGDRANVLIEGVYMYTHNQGSELPKIVQAALKRRERWDDGPYLARIIFFEMIRENPGASTGHGLSSWCGDGDYRILKVDADTQRLILNGDIYSFETYVNLENPAWPGEGAS